MAETVKETVKYVLVGYQPPVLVLDLTKVQKPGGSAAQGGLAGGK